LWTALSPTERAIVPLLAADRQEVAARLDSRPLRPSSWRCGQSCAWRPSTSMTRRR
jgi:hypothetical protein